MQKEFKLAGHRYGHERVSCLELGLEGIMMGSPGISAVLTIVELCPMGIGAIAMPRIRQVCVGSLDN